MNDFWTNLLIHIGVVTGATMLLMAVLWVIQKKIDDAGVVDVGWSFALGFAGVYAAIFADGDFGRRIGIGVIVGLWGIRLGWRLLRDRVLRGDEDGRYQKLRESWGEKFEAYIFIFFQCQALSVGLLALPFVLGAMDASPFPAWHDFAAGALWIIGLVGEGVADAQLARFKKRPDTKGRTCRDGLWAYSRHPNYFFTSMIWVAFGVGALGAPWGWLGLSAPAIILFLILKVTGIPPTEKRALESRPESYRKYQREVSPFIPWPPKTSDEGAES